MPIVSKATDYYLTYRFIKTLVTPFIETKAYELGIIDDEGNILKKSKDLDTPEERKAYGYFERMVWNLKKILERLPFLGSRFTSVVAASILLLKEETKKELNELKEKTFFKYFYTDMESLLQEEGYTFESAPTTNASSEKFAGLPPDDPPISKSAQNKYKKRNKKKKKKRKKFKDFIRR